MPDNKAVDISALEAYAGTNAKQLIVSLINSLDIANDISVMPNIKNRKRLGKLEVAPGIRPFSSVTEFQSDDLIYTNRFIETEKLKRELHIDPEVYRDSYLSEFLPVGSGAKQQAIPFAQFTWAEIIKAVAAEINNETAYFGFDKDDVTIVVYAAGSAYNLDDIVTHVVDNVKQWFQANQAVAIGETPETNPAKWDRVTARSICKGIEFYLLELITGGLTTPLATGAAADAATALAQSRMMHRNMSVPYRKAGTITHCSYDFFDLAIDGIEDKLSKYTKGDVTDGQSPDYIFIPGTNKKGILKPATWLGGSGRLITEPGVFRQGQYKGANLRMGTDLLSDLQQIETKKNLWTMEAGISALLGFQVADPVALKINDQS